MTDKLKSFLERHNYKITAVNTVLIITGIVIVFSQSNRDGNFFVEGTQASAVSLSGVEFFTD